MTHLLDLLLLYSRLSLLSFGGGPTVLPEMQREIVDVHGWMTSADFAALFALAQAAPGPNMLVSTLIGLRVAGLPGALAATFGMIAPSSLLTLVLLRTWDRFRDAPWRRYIQAGLVPVTGGLFLAAAVLIARAADHSLALVALTAAVAALSVATRLHPLWLLAVGAVLGVIGLG